MTNSKIVPITSLTPWAENPRKLNAKDFQRLMRQLEWTHETTGEWQTKPLVVTKDGGDGTYIVLGGNTRLEAFKALGVGEIWVSVVEAEDMATRLKYALSDNETAGYTKKDEMLGLLDRHASIPLADIKVNLGYTQTLEQVQGKFAPSNYDNDADLDEALAGGIKKIILNYDTDTFANTLKRLDALRQALGKNDFSEVVVFLIGEYWHQKV